VVEATAVEDAVMELVTVTETLLQDETVPVTEALPPQLSE
jgi:hypothetical protein